MAADETQARGMADKIAQMESALISMSRKIEKIEAEKAAEDGQI